MLTVLKDDGPPNDRKVLVRCECGTEKTVGLSNIKSGGTISCGCFNKTKDRTHGMTGSPEYQSWRSAWGRCNNPNYTAYERYGGRGIRMCKRWLHSFENFYADMGPRPPGTTLHRIRENGHYTPRNCKWADLSEQRREQRRESNIGFSRFKGVHRVENAEKPFHAMISVNNRTVRLGQFTDEVRAAKAYDKAALRFHKKRAVTNAMLGRL